MTALFRCLPSAYWKLPPCQLGRSSQIVAANIVPGPHSTAPHSTMALLNATVSQVSETFRQIAFYEMATRATVLAAVPYCVSPIKLRDRRVLCVGGAAATVGIVRNAACLLVGRAAADHRIDFTPSFRPADITALQWAKLQSTLFSSAGVIVQFWICLYKRSAALGYSWVESGGCWAGSTTVSGCSHSALAQAGTCNHTNHTNHQ